MRPLILAFLLFFAISCQNQESTKGDPERILVAVAANAYFPLEEIAQDFQEENAIEIVLISGSSGKLCNQIIQGAQFDLFFSADESYARKICDQKSCQSGPEIYTKGQLILSSRLHDGNLLSVLEQDQVRIAIPNPEIAPYGRAAKEFLSRIDPHRDWKKQLIIAESVSQANVYVDESTVDLGFVSLSTLYNPNLKDQFSYIVIPDSSYSPIIQSMVLLSEKPEARHFFDFILSTDAQEVFRKFGYASLTSNEE